MMMFCIDPLSVRSIVHILPLNHKRVLLTPWCLKCHMRPANRAVGLIFFSVTYKALRRMGSGFFFYSCVGSGAMRRVDTDLGEEDSAERCHVYILCLSKYIHTLEMLFAHLKSKVYLFFLLSRQC